MRRRALAAAALVVWAATVALVIVVAVDTFPRGLAVAACVVVAVVAAWNGVIRRGALRIAGLALAAVLLVAAIVLIATGDHVLEGAMAAALGVLTVACARLAFAVHVTLPHAAPPRHPVLFWNPRSGGGKAMRFKLEDEARARGIEPVELGPGQDLEQLVRDAIAAGADGLAMAGGDGSQAIVARIASEHDLPYACIPAGTRNHFALDLGVDRDDVVGALDAFVDGGERRVDLAEVNGRVFVNNVSLGLYADAVQSPGYREAKLRTIIGTLPDAIDAGSTPATLVSNNAYRLGRAIGSGTRPRLNGGVLGVAEFGRPLREWTTPRYEVKSDHPVNAGIDGEAVVLSPPLEFASRPRALRVRIARQHPGTSPSAAVPDSPWEAARTLAKIAFGRATA